MLQMTGSPLRRIHQRLGWIQAELADRVGVPPNSLARWEHGEVSISEPVSRLVGLIFVGERARNATAQGNPKAQAAIALREEAFRYGDRARRWRVRKRVERAAVRELRRILAEGR